MPDCLCEESWLGFQELTSAEIAIMKPSYLPDSTLSVSITRCEIKYNSPVLIQEIGNLNSASQLPGGG